MILKGMFCLLGIAIIGGSLLRWLLFPAPSIICLPLGLKLLTLVVCLVGGFSGYLVSKVSFFFYNKSLNYYSLRGVFGSI